MYLGDFSFSHTLLFHSDTQYNQQEDFRRYVEILGKNVEGIQQAQVTANKAMVSRIEALEKKN